MQEEKEEIEKIKKIDVFKDDWDSHQVKYMTNKQVLGCLIRNYRTLEEHVRNLRGDPEPNILDVGAREVINSVLREVRDRLVRIKFLCVGGCGEISSGDMILDEDDNTLSCPHCKSCNWYIVKSKEEIEHDT